MLLDGSGNPDPTNIVPVVTGSPTASTYFVGPVDLESGPNGDLFYVDLDAGAIYRLTYGLPTAVIQSDTTSGPAPLTVHFDGTHSSDPAGGGLTYSWTVPGGSCDSLTSANPTCTFGFGNSNVTLTVTDTNLVQNTSVPYTINAGETPPVPIIDTIDGAAPPTQPSGPFPPPAVRPAGVPAFWSVGDTITFSGHATDEQDGTEPADNLSWQLVMHHCPSDCHLHFLQTWAGTASGSAAAPDHEYPSYLELILTATDANSVSASTSVYLYPKIATIHVASVPSGIQLTVGDGNTVTTPADVTFIDGGSASLSAGSSAMVDGTQYDFASWSDSGAAAHNVTAHDGDTYTAAYLLRTNTYHPIAPVRVLDTRGANGLSGRFVANTPRTFAVAGRDGIPAEATSVTGNLTVTDETSGWAFYLGPDPVAHPSSSTVNFTKGATVANGLTVALSGTGTLSATYLSGAGNRADLVFDVTGYFTADSSGDTYHPVDPVRLLDTRSDNGLSGKFHANTARVFTIAGRGTVPSNATAITANVTAVNETSSWAVYVGPDPIDHPTTSTVNFSGQQVQANSLVVALSDTGTLSATYMSKSGNTTDLVLDVTGYFTDDATGARFVPIAPVRLLDTRSGNGLSGKLSANSPRTFQLTGRANVLASATAITGNVTVTGQNGGWAVYIGPEPVSHPGSSTLNFVVGDVKANGVNLALGSTGTVSATFIGSSGKTTNLILDVTGYFVP
jgi:hypothetical protein